MGTRARVHRGHAVRQGLHLAVLRHRPRAHGGRPRGRLRPDPPGQDLARSPTCCRCWRRSSRPASRCSSSPRTSRARRCRPWSSTRSAARSPSVAVKAPGFGDRRKAMLQDLAILTGGQVVSARGRPQARPGRPRGARHRPPGRRHQGRHHDRRRRRRQPRTSPAGSPRSRPRSSAPTPTGTARSCRSASPSWPAASASSRSARPPRSSSRRRSTASRTPSRRPARRSRRASSPAAAPPSSTPPRRSTAPRPRPATRRPASRSCASAVDEPLRWIAENAGLEGYVVVAKVRELRRRPAASTPPPASTATWSRRASSTRSR